MKLSISSQCISITSLALPHAMTVLDMFVSSRYLSVMYRMKCNIWPYWLGIIIGFMLFSSRIYKNFSRCLVNICCVPVMSCRRILLDWILIGGRMSTPDIDYPHCSFVMRISLYTYSRRARAHKYWERVQAILMLLKYIINAHIYREIKQINNLH